MLTVCAAPPSIVNAPRALVIRVGRLEQSPGKPGGQLREGGSVYGHERAPFAKKAGIVVSTVQRRTSGSSRLSASLRCLQQVVDVGAQLRGIRVPVPVHFPGRTGAQPIVRAAPREDRGVRLAQSSVVAVMRRHRRDAVRGLQWNDRPHGGERRSDADAEVDGQLIRASPRDR